MSSIDDRITLINELEAFPGKTDCEVGLIKVARGNAEHLQQPIGLKEKIDADAIFYELGFRIDRLKRRIEGGNVMVFNPPQLRARGPRMAKARLVG